MKNTVALITGGGSGIGKAIATRIILHGGRVVIVDTNPDGSKDISNFSARAKYVVADVTSETDIKQALEFAKKSFGGINVVINAAGIAAHEDPYNFVTNKPHSLDLYKRLMDVNALGTFNVTILAAGLIAANPPDENNQRGVIINVSSILAYDPPGYFVAYSATKAAVSGMTLPLARAFAPKGIRVVAVAPGFIDTPMAAALKEVSKRQFGSVELVNLSPKRQGSADEIAHMMQCIIENPFINAENIRVDGGYRYHPPPAE